MREQLSASVMTRNSCDREDPQTQSTRDEIESESMRVKRYMCFIIYVKSINNQCVCLTIPT